MNAILNKNSADVKGCTMYVALFPCNECAKLIIQSSIAEVVYVSDKYRDKPEMKASKRLLDMAGIKCRYAISLSMKFQIMVQIGRSSVRFELLRVLCFVCCM